MISHEYKCIFIHINKCGGTSIDHFFKGRHTGHNDALWYKRKYPHKFKKYYSFSFVRNPWDKLLSQYFWRKYLGEEQPNNEASEKTLLISREMRGMAFSDFLRNPVGLPHRSQLDWISDKKGNLLVDFVGRFENLQEDFDTACSEIGIPQQPLPHENKTKHKHYTEYYDDKTKQIVAEKYAKDIEFFGYEFGG